METVKQPIEALKQNAINALNHLIVSDELAKNYKAIMKISRFKEWLRESVQPAVIEPEAEDSELSDEAENGNERANNEVPQTIKFQ